MKRRLLDEPRCPRTICSRVPKRHPKSWAVRPATLFDLWGRRPCIRCCRKSTPNSPQWYKTCTEGTTYDHRRAVTCAPRESLRQDPPAPPLMMCQPSVASYRTASLATWATASGKTQTTMRSIPARATPLPSLPADQANTVPGRVDTIACQRIQLHGEPENGCECIQAHVRWRQGTRRCRCFRFETGPQPGVLFRAATRRIGNYVPQPGTCTGKIVRVRIHTHT